MRFSVRTRLLSTIIALSLLSSLVSPVFAITLPNSETVVDCCEVILEEHDDYVLSIRSEDLSNGNARFSMIENGQVISCSYVDRSAEMIIYINYQNGVEISREEIVIEQQVQSDSARAQMDGNASVDAVVIPDPLPGDGYVYVGKVGYNHYIQGMVSGINYIDWRYNYSYTSSGACNLRGQYSDFAMFVSVVALVLDLTVSAGLITLAEEILKAINIATTAVGFYVTGYEEVECKKTTVIWKASNAAGSSTLVQGSYCVITDPDRLNKVLYEGNYYPTTAIKNHNTELAGSVYHALYPGGDNFEIVSWP